MTGDRTADATSERTAVARDLRFSGNLDVPLRRRACAILAEETGVSNEEAGRTFQAAGEDLRIALLMAQVNLSREDALRLLDSHGGSVRGALDSMG